MFCAPKNMFPKQTNKKLRKEKKKDKKKKTWQEYVDHLLVRE